MKRWILIQCIILVTAILIGQSCKMKYTNSGISDAKTVQDVMNLNSGIYDIFTDEQYENFAKYKNEYIDEMNSSSVIVKAKATGNINQNHYSLGQEIEILDIVRGEDRLIGKIIYLYGNYGFCHTYNEKYNGLSYHELLNIMQPDQEYLVFMDPLKINRFNKDEAYYYSDPFFGYLNLSLNEPQTIQKQSNFISFSDLSKVEFLTDSQRVLNEMLDIKAGIIQKYVQ